jgi:alpha-amylase/alpha-mannosidase (GH57 family)
MPEHIYHALVLNLHQPWGNLDALLNDQVEQERWHGKECLFAYDRIPRAIENWEDVARVHLPMSGTLLEALSNHDFQSRVYGIVKCGDLLWKLRNPAIDIVGTGYYHPVFPLIPPADRKEHLVRWLSIGQHLFGRDLFHGFWPPEMGFCMEMIPLLKQAGYRYVIVDSEHISPITPMRWEELRYRPHLARFGEDEIVVIPRDRDLSIAQEGGMETDWFIREVNERCKWCGFEPLVCTATDGENGGWFRNVLWGSNFWGAFYHPLLHKVRHNETNVRPTFIHDYLDKFGAHGHVIVRTGAWNTGFHHGIGFVQWTGSQMQRDAWARLESVSSQIHEARSSAGLRGWRNQEENRLIEESLWRLLRAETSCHFFWGESWVNKAHAGMDDALHWLAKVHAARDRG